MGLPLGPTLANVFMCNFENTWLSTCPLEFKPVIYKRYVDDTFILFRDPSHAPLFLNYINSKHLNINFTMETEQNSALPFLDVSVHRFNNTFQTSVFRKDMFSGWMWLDVAEMKCLRNMCGVTRMDRVRNEVVRERVGVPEKLSERVDRKVLKWFGHVERMGNERMTKRVYMSEVEGERGRGRPPFRWRDGVRRACAKREIGLEEARGLCLDRDAWRSMTDRIV